MHTDTATALDAPVPVLAPERHHRDRGAAGKIHELLAEEGKADSGLRVFVQGGGCSGFQYGLMIEEIGGVGDQLFESNGVRLFVDPGEPQLPEGRRGRLRRHHHRRRLHHQEPERDLDLRVRVVVQRVTSTLRRGRSRASGSCARRAVARPVRIPVMAMSAPSRHRSPAPRGHQALQQARSDRQRLPQAGRPPERRRSRRPHQARRPAHQPRHRLPHAAVDGRRPASRARSISARAGSASSTRTGIRATITSSARPATDRSSSSAPTSRRSSRKWRPRATSPRARAWCRSTARAKPARPAASPQSEGGNSELLFARDAHAHRDCHRTQRA